MKCKKFFSLKHNIMLLFLPIIIVIVIFSGSSSYLLAIKQIEGNSYRNISDVVIQTKSQINERLLTVFGELVTLVNSTDMALMLTNMNQSEGVDSSRYLTVANRLERIHLSNYSMIDSVYMNINEGQALFHKVNYLISDMSFSFQSYRKQYQGSQFNYYWRNLHENDVFDFVDNDERVVSMFNLIGTESSGVRGIVMFHLKEAFFKQILEQVEISEHGYLALISKDGMMNFKDVEEVYLPNEEVKKYILERDETSGTFRFTKPDGVRMVVNYDTLPINEWRVAAIFPENDIINRVKYIKYVTIGMMIFVIIIAVFLSNLLLRMITKPISMLISKVKQVENGRMDTSFDIETKNEIGILNHVIGNLINRIKDLLRDNKYEQEQKHKAELAVLHEQIKPHFLYNTLHSISQLVELGYKAEAVAMLESISSFYRVSLSDGKDIISVQDEIQLTQHYLYIMGQRYNDSFLYEIDVDKSILYFSMIKLILQPLVENAIYHGAKQKRGIAIVKVIGFRQEDTLVFEVHDTGVGIPAEQLKVIQNSLQLKTSMNDNKSFGLYNIQARIQSHFGLQYGIKIKSEYGTGTIVKVVIPIVPLNGENLI